MKALVVDDSPINLKIAQKLLETEGLTVDTVLSGKECLEKVKSTKYDVIFMDIMMPEMDGVETFKKLKEQGDFNTPVITLTADAVTGAREKYLKEGFAEYISKPFTKEQIKEKIENIFKS